MIYEIALIAGSAIGFSWAGPPVTRKLRQVRLPSVRMPTIKALVDKRDELIPGVAKPTTTLARMIVLELLKDSFVPLNKSYEHSKFTIKWEVGRPRLTFVPRPTNTQCEEARREADMSAVWKSEFRTPGNRYYEKYSVPYARKMAERQLKDSVINVTVTGLDCVFDEGEINIIQTGLVDALKLHEERLAVKKKFENQQKAVDALAGWVGVEKSSEAAVKEEETPCLTTNAKQRNTKPKLVGAASTKSVLNPEDSM